MDTQGNFFLGHIVDPKTGKSSDQPVLYEPEDLTTHAVVVGMTGSGKTGLCIGLMEEAALNHIPALMIDPKGDITNALLHFPDLLPSDFQPWVDPDQARRAGITIEQAAAAAAENWKKGLEREGIGRERMVALRDSAQFAIYTPGSDSGIPVSILASLEAPQLEWETNREVLRERISSTVTALLGLVGMTDIDPVRSREHILLSNIFENSWKAGKDLNLGELIMQTQSPPFDKLGVFDVNAFFPEKDRFALAMLLNNILASPSFQSWIEGQPLDIPSLLYTPEGKPRHSVFYIAHLSDSERMFFVTLLYSAVETWMRTQTGSGTLRALVYFDEIFGYLPPTQNPPSKQPILRMLKQARAFGVGLVLVTQNPVDLDYKALSNAGTWMIGKLQTDRDKMRLLDGLEGAMAGNLDRSEYDKMISGLNKRVFLLHNVHNPAPFLFSTRFAMNFLAGPLTRAQIPALNRLAGAVLPQAGASTQPVSAPQTAAADYRTTSPTPAAGVGGAVEQKPPTTRSKAEVPEFSSTRPSLPLGVREYFLPNNLSLTQAFQQAQQSYPQESFSQSIIYRPALLAQASVMFFNRKYNLDSQQLYSALVPTPNRRGGVRWEDFPSSWIEERELDDEPAPQARFASLDAPFSDVKTMTSLSKDFIDWTFRSSEAVIRANEALKVYAGPDVSAAEFRTMCSQTAQDGRDAELRKTEAAYDKKIDALQTKLDRENRELAMDENKYSQRKMEELGTHAENIFGLFTGKRSSRRVSSSLSKRRMTSQSKAEVEESLETIADLKKQITALEKEKEQALKEVEEQWGTLAAQITEIKVKPLKKDVAADLFGVAWMPYHRVKAGEEVIELPGFSSKA